MPAPTLSIGVAQGSHRSAVSSSRPCAAPRRPDLPVAEHGGSVSPRPGCRGFRSHVRESRRRVAQRRPAAWLPYMILAQRGSPQAVEPRGRPLLPWCAVQRPAHSLRRLRSAAAYRVYEQSTHRRRQQRHSLRRLAARLRLHRAPRAPRLRRRACWMERLSAVRRPQRRATRFSLTVAPRLRLFRAHIVPNSLPGVPSVSPVQVSCTALVADVPLRARIMLRGPRLIGAAERAPSSSGDPDIRCVDRRRRRRCRRQHQRQLRHCPPAPRAPWAKVPGGGGDRPASLPPLVGLEAHGWSGASHAPTSCGPPLTRGPCVALARSAWVRRLLDERGVGALTRRARGEWWLPWSLPARSVSMRLSAR